MSTPLSFKLTDQTTEHPITNMDSVNRPRKQQQPRFRVPITAKPTQSTSTTTEEPLSPTDNSGINFTADYFGVSLTSTNIMDTSQAPVVLTTSMTTTTRMTTTTTKSTTTTTTTTTTSTTTTTTTFSTSSPIVEEFDFVSYVPINVPISSTEEIIIDENLPKCNSRILRTLEWPKAQIGQEIHLPCPLGSQGIAKWKCSPNQPKWETNFPDLSQCQSIWLSKIFEQLRKKVSVVHLAKEMAHYATFNPLYGGDILGLIDAIGAMTEKMKFELPEIPTQQQREAVVTEIVQSVVKTCSVMLGEENLSGWFDLSSEKRLRSVSRLTQGIKEAGMLLPMAVGENQEITVATKNICKCIFLNLPF